MRIRGIRLLEEGLVLRIAKTIYRGVHILLHHRNGGFPAWLFSLDFLQQIDQRLLPVHTFSHQ
ncbi:hypothetical protein D3C81_2102330 [compost metagenome]